jgi:hypothetical protein
VNSPFNDNVRLDKVMSTEQFTQVIEAILDGKYSWACVLILRFAGYNPLHYIPYRTYNRLIKDHCNNFSSISPQTPKSEIEEGIDRCLADERSKHQLATNTEKIKDLSHLELVGRSQAQIRGGCVKMWLRNQFFGARFK